VISVACYPLSGQRSLPSYQQATIKATETAFLYHAALSAVSRGGDSPAPQKPARAHAREPTVASRIASPDPPRPAPVAGSRGPSAEPVSGSSGVPGQAPWPGLPPAGIGSPTS
jgi:hypothetical protein